MRATAPRDAMAGPTRVKTGSLYDQGEVVRANGLDTWVVRAGARGGTPVVFLHGIPTSAYVYRDIIRAMHEERDCIAFDWPGFGQSAKPRHGDYTHQARAAHLTALLDALSLPQVDLVIHDVGGPAGLLFAVENLPRVRRLVVLNTTVYKRDYRPPLPAVAQFIPVVRDLTKPFFNRPTFDFWFKRGLAHPERVPRNVFENHWKLAVLNGGKHTLLRTWAQFPDGAGAIATIRGKLKELDRDTLVLFGAEDPFLPPPNAERLAKDLPRASLQLLPGAGHFVQEDAPDEVADRLLKFLA